MNSRRLIAAQRSEQSIVTVQSRLVKGRTDVRFGPKADMTPHCNGLEMQKVTELPMELPGRLGPLGWSAIIPERSIHRADQGTQTDARHDFL